MPIRTEPYVKVREVIKNAPTAIDADNNSDIGIVMVSDYGPELGRATGPSDFLSKYTIDGITVPRDAHISFINAYYMSYFSALVISRSTDTTATKGLMYYTVTYSDNTGEIGKVCESKDVWYKDNEWLNKTSTWELKISNSDGGAVAFVVNDTVYYANITKDDLVIMYPQYSNYTSFIALSDFIWNSGSTPDVSPEVCAEKFNDFLDSIRVQLNSINGVNVDSITPSNYTSTSDEFSVNDAIIDIEMHNVSNAIEVSKDSYDFTSYPDASTSEAYGTGTVIVTDINEGYTYVKVLSNTFDNSFVGKIFRVHATSITSDRLQLEEQDQSDPTIWNAISVYVSISALTCGTQSIDVDLDKPINYIPSKSYKITVNYNSGSMIEIGSKSYYFYAAGTPINAANYTAAFPVTNNNPMGQIQTRLESVNVHVIKADPDTNEVVYVTDETTNGTQYGTSESLERFSIRANINAAKDYLNVKLDNAIKDTFELIYNDDAYLVSLNPNKVDSNEVNIYIDYLNTVDLPFTVEVFNNEISDNNYYLGEPDEANLSDFGKGLHPDIASRTPYLLKAADNLGDQDQYDLAYLSCAGITKVSFVKRMAYIAMNNYWFLPIDVPYDRTSLASIKNYFNALALDSSYLEAMGPFDRNQSLTGWINYIAASSLFYERLMSNKQNNDEFAPIYKETYGVMNYTNPVKMLTKPQREELLSLGRPVNYVNYNNRTRNYFLNDDWTHQSADNVMSEEQNRRLVNKINRDIRHNMDQFIGKQNNAITRSQVVDMINYYMTNEIMTKSFAPEAYEVICNKKNNPDEVIRAKQLKVTLRVRLYNSIKYIDVIDEVYPIGVEFEG